MGDFIFELISETILEGILGNVLDGVSSKKTRLIFTGVCHAIGIAVIGVVAWLAYGNEDYFISGLFLLLLVFLLVSLAINIRYIVSPKANKKALKRIGEQTEIIIKKWNTANSGKPYILLDNNEGIAFGGSLEKPMLIIKIIPTSPYNSKNMKVLVRFSKDSKRVECFSEDVEEHIEICTNKAIETVEKYYDTITRFTDEQKAHQFWIEKEEVYNSSTGLWETVKETKGDSFFTRLFTFRTKKNIEELDFRIK